MPSELAQRIRDARNARGITLDQAEQATRIRRRYLEAIEAGDFAQLPDGPPGRGFVRNYARYLGLDPEAAIKLFEAEVGVPLLMLRDPAPPPPVRHKPMSRLTQVALPEPRTVAGAGEQAVSANAIGEGVQASAQQVVVRRDGTTGKAIVMTITRPLRASGSSFRLKDIRGPFAHYDPNMISARGPKQPFSAMPRQSWLERYLPYGIGALAIAGVLAFFVLVVAPAAEEWIGRVLPPQAQSATADEPAFVPQVTIFAPQPTRAPAVVAPPVTAREAAEATAPAEPAPIGGVQLALDARERAWVRVRVDGNVVFEGIPPLGPGIPFRAERDIQVETGNAGAFDIILNNVRLGPLGARNETVIKTWSATE
ncbi:MAG: helix-turn-helix domain-containing protein [Thermoflexales bacterium]|nr:helix-turn-helix domain-containing protein [Thermoflexales bacterium]MDW8352142.1 helix-turn-helix domain-containing protein [Anaerolineae bacterium]